MENVLRAIENLYGDSSLSHLGRVEKGALSENHIVESNGKKYFLKKYRLLGSARIQEIHSVKQYFSEGAIPVILPLRTHSNETFFELDENCYALFPFVSGIHIERGEFTLPTARELGRILGKIHAWGEKSTLPISLRTFNAWDPSKKLQEIAEVRSIIESMNNKTPFDECALESLALKEKLIRENSFTYESLAPKKLTLIHGDFLDHNVFFDTEGHISHVFDFEEAKYAPRTHELWRCLVYSFLNGENVGNELELAGEFLSAYREEAPITDEELRSGFLIFLTKTFHTLWVELEHYKLNNQRVDRFLEKGFVRLKYITENRESLIKRLCHLG